jgi:hypothetical protein
MPDFAHLSKRLVDRLHQSSSALRKESQDPANQPTAGAQNQRRGAHSKLYRPGDSVLESGIYEVVHDGQHRSAHEVVMIAADHFPTCESCMDRVRFRLIRTAPYIFTDQDFEEEQ